MSLQNAFSKHVNMHADLEDLKLLNNDVIVWLMSRLVMHAD